MQDLRRFLDTIVLCLRHHDVSRDIRRVILSQCILDEYRARNRANCVGPAYAVLSLMMLKPVFAQAYIMQIAQESVLTEEQKLQRQDPKISGLLTPVLLTRIGTDFLLKNKLLSEDHLPLNHPSERLGIISAASCCSLLVEYIDQNQLTSREQKGYFVLRDTLMALVEAYNTLEVLNVTYYDCGGRSRPHVKFHDLIKIVQKVFVNQSQLRFISPGITAKLGYAHEHITTLHSARVERSQAASALRRTKVV